MHDVVGSFDVTNECGCTPLDCAVRGNNSIFAKEMLKLGGSINKSFLTDERSPDLLEVLRETSWLDSHGRHRSMVHGKNAFEAARAGDLAILETFALLVLDAFLVVVHRLPCVVALRLRIVEPRGDDGDSDGHVLNQQKGCFESTEWSEC